MGMAASKLRTFPLQWNCRCYKWMYKTNAELEVSKFHFGLNFTTLNHKSRNITIIKKLVQHKVYCFVWLCCPQKLRPPKWIIQWYIYCIISYSSAAVFWNTSALEPYSNRSPESLQSRWNVANPYATGSNRPKPWYPPQLWGSPIWKLSATSQLVFSNMIIMTFQKGFLLTNCFSLDIFDTRVVTTAQATYGTLFWMYFTRLL